MSIDVHTHETTDEGDLLNHTGFLGSAFSTTSLSGSIAGFVRVHLTFTPWMFWPMFHTSAAHIRFLAHQTDGNSPDAPRAALLNVDANTHTYDLDYESFID